MCAFVTMCRCTCLHHFTDVCLCLREVNAALGNGFVWGKKPYYVTTLGGGRFVVLIRELLYFIIADQEENISTALALEKCCKLSYKSVLYPLLCTDLRIALL